MIEEVRSKTKLDGIKEEDFTEVQSYFNDKSVENARMAFKIRTHMVPKIPGNFKNKYKKKGTVSEGLTCPHCEDEEVMSQSHCLACSAWTDIRMGLDMTRIEDLVVFFKKLLVEREKVKV